MTVTVRLPALTIHLIPCPALPAYVESGVGALSPFLQQRMDDLGSFAEDVIHIMHIVPEGRGSRVEQSSNWGATAQISSGCARACVTAILTAPPHTVCIAVV